MLSALRTAVIPYRRPKTSRFSGTLASCHPAAHMTQPPSWDPGRGSQLLTWQWPTGCLEHFGFVTGEMILASSDDEELCKGATGFGQVAKGKWRPLEAYENYYDFIRSSPMVRGGPWWSAHTLTHVFSSNPGLWEWLLLEALKIALNIEYSIPFSRMPNLELIIELLEIQNITLEEGVWYGRARRGSGQSGILHFHEKLHKSINEKVELKNYLGDAGSGDAQCWPAPLNLRIPPAIGQESPRGL